MPFRLPRARQLTQPSAKKENSANSGVREEAPCSYPTNICCMGYETISWRPPQQSFTSRTITSAGHHLQNSRKRRKQKTNTASCVIHPINIPRTRAHPSFHHQGRLYTLRAQGPSSFASPSPSKNGLGRGRKNSFNFPVRPRFFAAAVLATSCLFFDAALRLRSLTTARSHRKPFPACIESPKGPAESKPRRTKVPQNQSPAAVPEARTACY